MDIIALTARCRYCFSGADVMLCVFRSELSQLQIELLPQHCEAELTKRNANKLNKQTKTKNVDHKKKFKEK